ncbi:MAG TPA: hypothetical protein DIU08_06710, partial [Ktedonobacter sp.]|nr:hypothetical protein [Ktedonobacter sp.]
MQPPLHRAILLFFIKPLEAFSSLSHLGQEDRRKIDGSDGNDLDLLRVAWHDSAGGEVYGYRHGINPWLPFHKGQRVFFFHTLHSSLYIVQLRGWELVLRI